MIQVLPETLYMKLPNYSSYHQISSDCKGGGIFVYVHKTFKCKTRSDLNLNIKDIEVITVEIVSKK